MGKAENDLLNVENNLAATRVPWDTVCFHAQQAAEKLLKAFLVFHGQEPPRTHNRVALLVDCSTVDASLTMLEAECRNLTYFAVSARYPGEIAEPTEGDGRTMVAAARRVQAAVLARLPRPEDA